MITTPESNRVEIVRNATNIANIKKDILDIKEKVTNCIPTQIKALDKRVDKIDVQSGQLLVKMGAVIAIITFAIQYFLK